MSKTINDLRETLFATLEAVRAGDMDLDKARAINDVAKTIVDTAKVEVDYLRTTGGGEARFLEVKKELPPGITGTTVHKLR